MLQETKQFISTLLTFVLGSTAVGSLADGIEQYMRILLLAISIVSGVFLIAVNWEKGMEQFKKWRGK